MSEADLQVPVEIRHEVQTRVRGVVRKMKGGYGFIAGYDGVDYFMHWTNMKKGEMDFRKLNVGDRVDFEPINPDRPRAVEVAVIG